MRHDKDHIIKLREEGKSYRAIQAETGVSRGTLAKWFKRSQSLGKVGTITNTENRDVVDRMIRLNNQRKTKLDAFYRDQEALARSQYEIYKHEPLFWAGIMAYAGEGDKQTKHRIRITNSEFYIHSIFIQFVLKYMGISRETIKVGLLIYPTHNESLCREMWSNILHIPRENFYKTQVLQGKPRGKRLQYGIGMSIISNTALKKKLYVWLALAQDEKFAGMV